MSSLLRCSLCLAFCGLLNWLMVEAISPASRLKVRPFPVPVQNAEGWQGSSEFTDWQLNIVPGEQPGIQYSNDSWRMRGVCTQVTFTLVASDNVPGKFILKDPIGDVLTSEGAMIRLEPNSYMIFWGCTKPSVIPDQCADPWLDILTRDKFPLPAVWFNIDISLMHAFGLRLAEIERVKHTPSQCVPSIPREVKG